MGSDKAKSKSPAHPPSSPASSSAESPPSSPAVARSRPAPAKRITKGKQVSKKKKMAISTTFSSSEDEADAEAKKVVARKKKGKKPVEEEEGTAEEEDDDDGPLKDKALKAGLGIRVQKLHKSIVEHKHSQYLIWQGQPLEKTESEDETSKESRKADDESDEEEVSLSARKKSKVPSNKKNGNIMKKPQPRAIRKSTSSVKASMSFDSSEGESVNMSAALDTVEKLSEEETLRSPKNIKSPPRKALKTQAKDVMPNPSASESDSGDSEEDNEPEGTVLPDSLRGAPELRQFWRILALEVGAEEEVEDLRTDAQLERRVLEVGMGDVVSRELEKKAEARRHKEDQRHLAQHNLRNAQVNVSNARKTNDWNSECEEELERFPSKEERAEELKKGLKLIKARLDQRLGRSPSVAKSTKKQKKSKNVSDEEDSSPRPEVNSKGKRTAPKGAKTESKKTGESSGEEESLTSVQNSKSADSNKVQKKTIHTEGKSDASDMEADIKELESEVKELKKNTEAEEATEKVATSEQSDSNKKIVPSSNEADKHLSNSEDELNLESFLSDNEEDEEEKRGKDKSEKDKAEKKEAEKEKTAKEKIEKENAEKEKAKKEKAEKEKAEKEKANKEKAEKEKAEKEKAKKEKAEKEKARKEKAEKENAEREKAEKEKVSKEVAVPEKADKGKGDKEKTEKAGEKISDKDAEASDDAIPRKNALAALSDSDDDFPAPVGADDSDKEDAEEGKSMEEKLKQKLREKEAEQSDSNKKIVPSSNEAD